MKTVIVILAAMVLGGCGSYQTLEQLEEEALLSGDWSKVEQRERLIANRAARTGMSCPDGLMRYCENRGTFDRCGCISSDDAERMLMSYR
jgi:hypothetical protein